MKQHVDTNRERRQNMNWDEAGNNWETFKDEIHERWQWLSEEDISQVEGRREKLLLALQRTYALSPQEAEEEIRNFESGDRTIAGAGSGRGPTERAREFGSGNEQGGHPHNDKHGLH